MTVNISKIYFLVHPFYDARKGGENEKVVLKPEQAKEMIQLYKGEIKKKKHGKRRPAIHSV